METETRRLVALLKLILAVLDISRKEVARRMKMNPSYLGKVLSGVSRPRLDHVIGICLAIDLEPAEFFHLAYPQKSQPGSHVLKQIRELFGGPYPPPEPEAPDGAIAEEQTSRSAPPVSPPPSSPLFRLTSTP